MALPPLDTRTLKKVAKNQNMNLQLSLKREWFEMTKSGEKTEDYREITDYWCRRLIRNISVMEYDVWEEFCEDLKEPTKNHDSLTALFNFFGCRFKDFTTNTMTLGYPSKTDIDRIIKFEHAGIEIRTGNPEWGAEEGKIYFVIKHSKRLN